MRPGASVGYVRATRTSLPRWVRTGRTGRLAPRAPRTVRTGYAYQPRAYRTYSVRWHPRLWLKLAANAVLNPLTALWDCENGEVLARAEGREAAQQVCEEVQAVCAHLAVSDAAAGLRVSDLTGFVHECAAANARNLSSMCMDVRNGRRTEIEQLNGWIERKSRGIAKGTGTLATSPSWTGKNGELADAVRRLHPVGVPPSARDK